MAVALRQAVRQGVVTIDVHHSALGRPARSTVA
jgi:hypothetical protein